MLLQYSKKLNHLNNSGTNKQHMPNDWGFDPKLFDFGMHKPIKTHKGRIIKKERPFNPIFDGLDLGKIDMNFGNFNIKNQRNSENNFESGNFFKYIPDLGRTAQVPRGYGKESKKNKARRSITRSESPALYGMESLENAIDDSYESLGKGAKRIKENFGVGPTRAKAFYKRKFEKDTRIPRKIVEKIKEYKTKRKISRTLQPDYESNIGFDRSREISSTYGKVTTDIPEQKYDYYEKNKEKWR